MQWETQSKQNRTIEDYDNYKLWVPFYDLGVQKPPQMRPRSGLFFFRLLIWQASLHMPTS